MSEIKVNKITPRVACGTTQLGDSGDTITIPSGATITNSGTASGFGATGETSWDTTVKTTGTFTATAGVGYFLNTTGGIITVNLPVGAAGSSVAMADYAGTWQTNTVTVAANGTEKIGGVDADVALSTEGQSVTFVYIDGTQGWVNVIDSTSNVRGNAYIVATGGTPCTGAIVCTNYKTHTFTGPGTFTVSNAGAPAGSDTVDYLVVAGGGGGGKSDGGGGGAGGYRESPGTASGSYTVSPLGAAPAVALPVPVQGYPITVGGGGAGSPTCVANPGVVGNPSIFSSITSTAGGGGGGASPGVGAAGGSGGAGASVGTTCGGAGNTPPTNPAQGSDGGNTGGGGGGATAVGANGPGPASGGAGATTCITASPITKSAGGEGDRPGGGSYPAAPANSGNGGGGICGGGPGSGPSGSGGSGIVVIRYKFQ